MSEAEIVNAPSINDYHNSNFLVTMSNMPGIQAEHDMAVFHNFIREVTLPGFSLNTLTTNFKGEQHLHNVGTQKNTNLDDITITFKLSEGLYNYFLIANYITSVRYEKNYTAEAGGPEQMKKNNIKNIFIDLLNNEKKPVGRLTYTNCVPVTLSNLNLSYTDTNIVTFTSTFRFEELGFELL
jgi:hypothetical protein